MSAFVLNRNYELILPEGYVSVENEEIEYIDGGGFVGIRIIFGSKIKKMSGIAAGAFAAGYVGFSLKELALTGPWGAGAAAAITASVSAVVGYAVSKGLSYVDVGVNVPFANWKKNIYTP